MRFNLRRMAVARIDVSGSVNHQTLLKDATSRCSQGRGIVPRQVGVSKKKSRYCLLGLVFS